DYCIPLVIQDGGGQVFPMYYAHFIDENTLAFPVTNATGIDSALKEAKPATALVVDRAGTFEAYLLEGTARFVSDKSDFDLVSEMRNLAQGFPIHAAVVFEVKNARLTPPP
ncbi:MAG TPA: hypothetical protein VGK34_00825, partial [Armatimonadota bacterium]